MTEEAVRLTREQLEQVVQLLAESEWSLREPSAIRVTPVAAGITELAQR